MQVSGIGNLWDMAEELGDTQQAVVLTGTPAEIARAKILFLQPVRLMPASMPAAIRAAALRGDMDLVETLTMGRDHR